MDVFPEVEGPIRDWLRTQQPLLDLLGDAKFIYFGAPDTPDKPASWITFSRLGGSPPDTMTPEDAPYITFDCWGRSKHLAAQLAAGLVAVLQNARYTQPTMGPLKCRWTKIALGPRFQPDQNNTAAYVIDAYFYFVIPQVA